MKVIAPHQICAECGQAFKATHGRQTFCTPQEKERYYNRQSKRGKVIMDLLQVWRGAKSRRGDQDGKWAFGELCRLLDAWNLEDRKAGRRPDVNVRRKRTSLWSASDIETAA